ncbi:hypothetical protein POG22_01415 [Geitlerinema sp. CS-897]|nr:hypothetical protein [Geitlerinema sp. CS-897]
MSVAQELQKIVAIEQEFDVNSVTYKGLNIWPIVRFNIEYFFGHIKKDPNALGRLRVSKKRSDATLKFSQIQSDYAQHSCAWQNILTQVSGLEHADILFFSKHENYSEKINGKFFDRCLDSIHEQCDPQLSALKIELDFPQGRKKQPRFYPCIFVDPYPCLKKEALLRKCLTYSLKNLKIQNFKGLQKVVWKHTSFYLHEDQILDQLYLHESYHKLFIDLLSIIRPRAVFLVCHYYIVAKALVQACHELGIKTIDVQHGQGGRYHSQYAHWTRIPVSGYELLPDFFWVWSEQCKNHLMETRPYVLGNYTHHLPVVGGNPWLSKWLDDDLGLSQEEKNFLDRLHNHKKIVLVSLQNSTFLPELLNFLIPAMKTKRNDDDYFWLIRFHPLHRSQREVDSVLTPLQKHNIKNFDIHFSSSMPLYSLLKRCHYHVTSFSSVSYEASVFGVKTGIVDPQQRAGYVMFKDQIQKGSFDYITSSGDIINNVYKSTRKPMIQNFSDCYIDPRPEISRDALNRILENLS